jgi:chemotaxis protein MotA
MDLATIFGVLGGLAAIAVAIALAPGASLRGFFDWPAIFCVLGGATAAVLASSPRRQFLSLYRVGRKALFHRLDDMSGTIAQIVSLSETARRDGLLALEARLAEVKHPFLVLGLQMTVDGTRPELIEEIMRTEMEALAARHRNGRLLFEQFAKYGPAFGLIGTLIGLIIMLGNMRDPEAIGPAMAVALTTTFYGSVLANIVCLPLADKLHFLSRHELLCMEIILRGILGIQCGDNPHVIEQRLHTYVPPELREPLRKAA